MSLTHHSYCGKDDFSPRFVKFRRFLPKEDNLIEEDRVSPYGFWRYGRDFFNAASHIQKPPSDALADFNFVPRPVPYFLLGRSIELLLKSFLLGRNVSANVLKRKYGHDLSKLLKLARKRKLGILVKLSRKELLEIQRLNVRYSTKDLEYFSRGAKGDADYSVVFNTAERLLSGLKAFTWQKTKEKRTKQNAPPNA